MLLCGDFGQSGCAIIGRREANAVERLDDGRDGLSGKVFEWSGDFVVQPILQAVGGVWQVDGAPDASLALLAQWLHEHGLAGRWRNELLAVTLASGTPVAAIERAAVRPLGYEIELIQRAKE